MPNHRISHAEWTLLETLWGKRRATAREVTDTVEASRGWAYSTVKTMLDRMATKGLVRARQVGTVWEYTPAVEPANARTSAWKRFVESAFGGAIAPALHFVMSQAQLSTKERNTLLALLNDTPPASPRSSNAHPTSRAPTTARKASPTKPRRTIEKESARD